MSSGSKRRVAYFYDHDIGSFSYGWVHPMKPFRMRLTHSLVSAYNMLPMMDVIRPTRASPKTMTRFHTDEYVDFLHRVTPDTAMDMTGGGAKFLSGDDNPAFDGVFEFSSISAGGSIAAAERINNGTTDIAINWAGGLHHAKKGEGSGFCYINDIVLAILELLRVHTRVLYIDIDFHHGDGVEEAFYSTDRVLTCSFHKQKDSFPGTGKLGDRGIGKGKGYAVNVPLLQGVTDPEYKSIFEPVIQHILDWFRPDAVVLQCGADSLSEDKLGCFNLSMEGHAACAQFLRSKNIPLIMLGGGGYTVRNVASAWTYETAVALGIEKDLDLNVPYSEFLEWYGPRYKLEIKPSNITNDNQIKGYLDKTKHDVLQHLHDLPFAPSVAQHSVPRTSVAQEIGVSYDERDEEDRELDAALVQRVQSLLGYSRRRSTDDSDEDGDEAMQSDSGGEDSVPFPINISSNARNLYYTPPLATRRPWTNGHRNGDGDSDEDVRISEDEDEEDEEDERPAFGRRASNHHTASNTTRGGRQKAPHGHGTRAAIASVHHHNGAQPGISSQFRGAKKRTFFTLDAPVPVPNAYGMKAMPNAKGRPQMWNGVPLLDVPHRPRGVVL